MTTINNLAPTFLPTDGEIDFAVAYATDSDNNPIQVILTNQSQAICVYTVNQSNPVIWDSLFSQAFVATLAAYLVPALSLNLQLMNMQIKIAEAAISQARVRDGDEGVTSQNRQADWIVARTTGGTLWGGGYSNGYCGYSNMIWPGGF